MGGYIRGWRVARKPAETLGRCATWLRGCRMQILTPMAAIALATAYAAMTGPTLAAGAWQYTKQSSGTIGRSFVLGIRNPGGRGPYRAIFVVGTPDGRTLRRVVRIFGSGWGQLRYPQAFGANYLPGVYSFRVVVRGRTVIRSRFRLR